jgi:hypothetical protein
MKIKNPENSIFCDSNNGPHFGHDIRLDSKFDSNNHRHYNSVKNNQYTKFNQDYVYSYYVNAGNSLTETNSFTVKEIEVYVIV